MLVRLVNKVAHKASIGSPITSHLVFPCLLKACLECMCERKREIDFVCVFVCVREREREGDHRKAAKVVLR